MIEQDSQGPPLGLAQALLYIHAQTHSHSHARSHAYTLTHTLTHIYTYTHAHLHTSYTHNLLDKYINKIVTVKGKSKYYSNYLLLHN